MSTVTWVVLIVGIVVVAMVMLTGDYRAHDPTAEFQHPVEKDIMYDEAENDDAA